MGLIKVFRPQRQRDVSQRLGWLISVGGVVLIFSQMTRSSALDADFAPWWKTLSFAVIGLIVFCAIFGLLLPTRVFRVAWITVSVLGMIVQLLTFQGYLGNDPNSIFPWEWTLVSVFVSYPVLVVSKQAAIVFAVVAGFVPALSGFLAYGRVPEMTAIQTPIQVSNFVFAIIFLGVRFKLQQLQDSEGASRVQEERLLRADIDTARHKRFARLVHDEVLATLSAAQRFSGHPPSALIGQAKNVIDVLERPMRSIDEPVEGVVFANVIAEAAKKIDKDCEINKLISTGAVPGEVAEAVIAAASEALRNSVKHAGDDAERGLLIQVSSRQIRVEIRDDGVGFDLKLIPEDRLGVQDSIFARMRGLPGGSATIITSNGQGARVVLRWIP